MPICWHLPKSLIFQEHCVIPPSKELRTGEDCFHLMIGKKTRLCKPAAESQTQQSVRPFFNITNTHQSGFQPVVHADQKIPLIIPVPLSQHPLFLSDFHEWLHDSSCTFL